ncbi:ABC transporter permease [Blautia obeum]|jgi:ribose/xylose/arabinose/galactoside ABC-type transport system permease subunit|uniref:ABC transporter permease n=1 Tax=Blautia obeum TaxID=40520 RepID=A0A411ZQP3_9FIRM|nr:ABC transporter permease [Blautia obeum]RGQ05186.1 ABC transporter permease [Blautia obeum]
METIKKITKRNEVGILIPLLLIWIITFIANNAFLTSTNMIALFRTVSITLLGAIGATFLFACGMMDVSSSSIYALSGIVIAVLMKNFGLNPIIACLGGLLVGALAGLANGFIVNTFDIPAFIATLGTQYIFRGVVNVVSQGSAYTGFPESFSKLGGAGPLGIPWSIYIAVVVALIAAWLLKYSTFGRSLLAVGGNPETARVCGINVKKVRYKAFILSGILCASAGILSTARLATAQPSAATGWEMTVIAATIIGGVSMYGGTASIFGVVIGVCIMETLTISMTMLKVNPYWQKIVVGFIIVLAVIIDTYRRLKSSGGNS